MVGLRKYSQRLIIPGLQSRVTIIHTEKNSRHAIQPRTHTHPRPRPVDSHTPKIVTTTKLLGVIIDDKLFGWPRQYNQINYRLKLLKRLYTINLPTKEPYGIYNLFILTTLATFPRFSYWHNVAR